MIVETTDCLYDFRFQHAQLEITGRCNMRCQHCRAWHEARVDMPLELVKKALRFAMSEADDDFRLTISGGEPLLHRDLLDIVTAAKGLGIESMIITTNASLATEKILFDLDNLNVPNLAIQVSVDSVVPDKHDEFRGSPGAFSKAMTAFERLRGTKLVPSLRASLTPDTLPEVEALVQLAIEQGARRIGLGSVIPAGRGLDNHRLLMKPQQKREFLEAVAYCKKKYPQIDVTTEDPLKFALEDCPWDCGDGVDINDGSFFGGCTAGVSGFNVDSEGVVTPCAVFLEPIVNLKDVSVEEALEIYRTSPVIVRLAERRFSGRCGECHLKRLCGGCRAVARGYNQNYLGEDATCWLNGVSRSECQI